MVIFAMAVGACITIAAVIWSVEVYKLGKKHGIIIGRAQLAEEIMVQQERHNVSQNA